MKRISFLILTVALLAFAGSAFGQPNKDPKQIRHCGCVFDTLLGADMVYHDVFVSSRARGHRNHVAGSQDFCFAGLDEFDEATFKLWERTGDDCRVDGAPDPDLDDCTDEVEFANCGIEVVE